jgi:hypothetical protein
VYNVLGSSYVDLGGSYVDLGRGDADCAGRPSLRCTSRVENSRLPLERLNSLRKAKKYSCDKTLNYSL